MEERGNLDPVSLKELAHARKDHVNKKKEKEIIIPQAQARGEMPNGIHLDALESDLVLKH